MLSEQDLAELERTLLPALERHHLRLLAHSLRCLQQASATAGDLQAWAEQHPQLQADPAFIPVLVEQLSKAAVQLEQIGQQQGKPPLQLELADLVAWGQRCADARLTPPHS